jgi:hypothetical protein
MPAVVEETAAPVVPMGWVGGCGMGGWHGWVWPSSLTFPWLCGGLVADC